MVSEPLAELMASAGDQIYTIAEEIESGIDRLVDSDDPGTRRVGLHLAIASYNVVAVPGTFSMVDIDFWYSFTDRTTRKHAGALLRAAEDDSFLARSAVMYIVELKDILSIGGNVFTYLWMDARSPFAGAWMAYFPWLILRVMGGDQDYSEYIYKALTQLGDYILSHPATPWFSVLEGFDAIEDWSLSYDQMLESSWHDEELEIQETQIEIVPWNLSAEASLGVVAVVFMSFELGQTLGTVSMRRICKALPGLDRYILARLSSEESDGSQLLPDLGVPTSAASVLHDWANRRVDLLVISPSQHISSS
jgi:hypothetical protein